MQVHYDKYTNTILACFNIVARESGVQPFEKLPCDVNRRVKFDFGVEKKVYKSHQHRSLLRMVRKTFYIII